MSDAASDAQGNIWAQNDIYQAKQELIWKQERKLYPLRETLEETELAFLQEPSMQTVQAIRALAQELIHTSRIPINVTKWIRTYQAVFRAEGQNAQALARYRQELMQDTRKQSQQKIDYFARFDQEPLKPSIEDWADYIWEVRTQPDHRFFRGQGFFAKKRLLKRTNEGVLSYALIIHARTQKSITDVFDDIRPRHYAALNRPTPEELTDILNDTGHIHYFGGRE